MSEHEVSSRPGRVAVIGGGRHGHLICHAMKSTALPVFLDLYGDHTYVEPSPIQFISYGFRRITGIDAIYDLNRADVLARYDAVVYALDAYPEPSRRNPFSRTTTTHSPSILRGLPLRHVTIDNRDGAIRGCPTEFVVGPLQQIDSRSALRAPEDIAALVVRSITSTNASTAAESWTDADPADWLNVQFPRAHVMSTSAPMPHYRDTHLTLVG